jgi:RNA polymerase sigma factor (TIGR02999 family)
MKHHAEPVHLLDTKWGAHQNRHVPPIVDDSRHDVTELLQAWTAGDTIARERAVALVYAELRRRAAAHLRRERSGHTLQPTALVHEAYLRLIGQRTAWQNRAQFLAMASQMMRRILVDRARARLAARRSGQWTRIVLDEVDNLPMLPAQVDLLSLDVALERLTADHPRKGRIAELRFFGGLTLEETGEVMQLSSKTVQREWDAARVLLFKMLSTPSEDVQP